MSFFLLLSLCGLILQYMQPFSNIVDVVLCFYWFCICWTSYTQDCPEWNLRSWSCWRFFINKQFSTQIKLLIAMLTCGKRTCVQSYSLERQSDIDFEGHICLCFLEPVVGKVIHRSITKYMCMFNNNCTDSVYKLHILQYMCTYTLYNNMK